MTAGLAELMQLSADMLWQGFVVFFRLAAIVSLLPAFGERSVSVRVKLAVTLAFVLITAPALPLAPSPPELDGLTILVLTETIIGVMLGIGIRLFVMALQTAGSIAAQSTSLSQILGGAAVDPLPAIGYILIVAGLALATMTGLHVKAAALMILSYDILPMGQFQDGGAVSSWGVAQIANAFALAFTLAAPFVILSVIYNIALGAINKAMPQLMVAFIGAPVITAGGLFVLMLAAPFMLEVWLSALDNFLASPLRVSR